MTQLAEGTRQLHILHLSDPHFGPEHRFNPPHPDDAHPTLGSSLSKELKSRQVNSPVICCITGDFTQENRDEEYEQAVREIRTLADRSIFQNGVDDFFLVQGNHDVDWSKKSPFQRWPSWRNFYGELYPDQPLTNDPVSLPLVHDRIEDLGAVIVTLNSSVFVSKTDVGERNKGRLGTAQLDKLRTSLEQLDAQRLKSAIRIAIVHHHPILIPSLVEEGREYDAIADSEDLLTILRKYAFQLILHGHKHHAMTLTDNAVVASSRITPEQILIVSGGSVASKGVPSGPAGRNTYNWITIKWIPEALQARIRVETFALRTFDEDNVKLLPTQWSWEPLKTDERILNQGSDFPPVLVTREREFEQEKDGTREAERTKEYARTRGNLPVVALIPSLESDQVFEARVWIVHHSPKDMTDDPESYPAKVVWTAGQFFEVGEIEREEDPLFCASFHFYDSALFQAEMTFPDGSVVRAHTYARMPKLYSERI